MGGIVKRLGMVCAVLAGFAVPAWAVVALPCAEYISSRKNDVPMFGQLIGSEVRTVTLGVTVKAEIGGIGGSTNGSLAITWEVGFYKLTTGEVIQVDCRNYTLM